MCALGGTDIVARDVRNNFTDRPSPPDSWNDEPGRPIVPSRYKKPLSTSHDSLHRPTQRAQHPLHFASAKSPLARAKVSDE